MISLRYTPKVYLPKVTSLRLLSKLLSPRGRKASYWPPGVSEFRLTLWNRREGEYEHPQEQRE